MNASARNRFARPQHSSVSDLRNCWNESGKWIRSDKAVRSRIIDRETFDQVQAMAPRAEVVAVYGSTEAEPIAGGGQRLFDVVPDAGFGDDETQVPVPVRDGAPAGRRGR